jgi:hypothetical protein
LIRRLITKCVFISIGYGVKVAGTPKLPRKGDFDL